LQRASDEEAEGELLGIVDGDLERIDELELRRDGTEPAAKSMRAKRTPPPRGTGEKRE
jgi:hypothetical protein